MLPLAVSNSDDNDGGDSNDGGDVTIVMTVMVMMVTIVVMMVVLVMVMKLAEMINTWVNICVALAICQVLYEVGIIIPIVQMRKLSQSEINNLSRITHLGSDGTRI